MGKATDIDSRIRSLSRQEREARSQARAIAGSDVRAALDGRIVRTQEKKDTAQELMRPPVEVWD